MSNSDQRKTRNKRARNNLDDYDDDCFAYFAVPFGRDYVYQNSVRTGILFRAD